MTSECFLIVMISRRRYNNLRYDYKIYILQRKSVSKKSKIVWEIPCIPTRKFCTKFSFALLVYTYLWPRIGRHVESDFLVKTKRRVERKSEALISAVGALCSLRHQDTARRRRCALLGLPETQNSPATTDRVPWKEA